MPIIGSVFKVPVQSEVDASKVTASGNGVDPENCRAVAALTFKVDAKRSAKAPLEVQVTGDKGPIAQKPEIKDNKDGTYDVTYVPPPEGSKCDVKVTYGGKDIAGRYWISVLESLELILPLIQHIQDESEEEVRAKERQIIWSWCREGSVR